MHKLFVFRIVTWSYNSSVSIITIISYLNHYNYVQTCYIKIKKK